MNTIMFILLYRVLWVYRVDGYMTKQATVPFTHELTTVSLSDTSNLSPEVVATVVFGFKTNVNQNPPCTPGDGEAPKPCTWDLGFEMLPGPINVLSATPQAWVLYLGGIRMTIRELWLDGIVQDNYIPVAYTQLTVTPFRFYASRPIRIVNISLTIDSTEYDRGAIVIPPLVYFETNLLSGADNYQLIIGIIFVIFLCTGVLFGLLLWYTQYYEKKEQ